MQILEFRFLGDNEKSKTIFNLYLQRINREGSGRCYNINRSYGTVTSFKRAIGSDDFVKLDFSPVYNEKKGNERTIGSVHL